MVPVLPIAGNCASVDSGATRPHPRRMQESPTDGAGVSAMRWWLLSGVWLLYGSFGLIVTSLAPVVADVETALGMSHVAMGSVMGAWQLVYIFAAIPCGILLDRLGGRHALLIGAILIAASAFGRSFAANYIDLLLAVMVLLASGSQTTMSASAPAAIQPLRG